MNTISTTEAQTDMEEVFAAFAEDRKVDPEVSKRIEERANRVSQEIFQKHGYLNVAVDLIREGRDEG